MKTLEITTDGITRIDDYLPCPYCGSLNLRQTEWWDYDDDYEVIECRDCKATAPGYVWNNRSTGTSNEPINKADNRDYEVD